MEQKRKSIASLNDAFRHRGNGFMMTPGVQELSDVLGLIGQVIGFDDFTEDNDPHGEHDFGVIDKPEWPRVFWKIDYYDQKLEFGLDALDPECRRVLTVMLASEY